MSEDEFVSRFDVTCVIGTVTADEPGFPSAAHAAMALIAEHDAEGRYEFPLPGGRKQLVTIERVPR